MNVTGKTTISDFSVGDDARIVPCTLTEVLFPKDIENQPVQQSDDCNMKGVEAIKELF